MTEIEFAALMVSRVCHDLVGPLGAVVNGMEVLEDERDPAVDAEIHQQPPGARSRARTVFEGAIRGILAVLSSRRDGRASAA